MRPFCPPSSLPNTGPGPVGPGTLSKAAVTPLTLPGSALPSHALTDGGGPSPAAVPGGLAVPRQARWRGSSHRLPGARPGRLAVGIANRDPSGSRARPARGTERVGGLPPNPCRSTSPG